MARSHPPSPPQASVAPGLRRRSLCALAAAALAAGCATVAQVTTLSQSACRDALTTALADTMIEQKEAPPTAQRLARDAVAVLAVADAGLRPFLVSSPSGADYAYFVERRDDACLLRLYGWQKGFVSYTNDVTYIATRPLGPCRCAG